jgi:hypothetical protein
LIIYFSFILEYYHSKAEFTTFSFINPSDFTKYFSFIFRIYYSKEDFIASHFQRQSVIYWQHLQYFMGCNFDRNLCENYFRDFDCNFNGAGKLTCFNVNFNNIKEIF